MPIEKCKLKIAEAWFGSLHFAICNLQFAIVRSARRGFWEQF